MTSSAPRPVLMLVEKSSHCLSFYDAETTALLDSVALPHFSHEIAVSADRRHVYVGHYGVRNSADPAPGGSSVTVIDIAARKVVRSLDCRPYGRPHGIALDGLGRLHVLSEGADMLLRFDDPLADTVPSRAVPSGGVKSHLLALSADGAWAYCANLLSHTVTKVAPGAAVAPVAMSPGEKPEGLWLDPGGGTLYIANRQSDTLVAVDTATMAAMRSMPTRRDPLRVYGIGDGRLLVANCGDDSISIVDAASMTELGCLRLAGIPVAACVHAGSGSAFVSLTTDQCVQVELGRLQIIRTFTTRSEPDCCFLLDAPAADPPMSA